jgi:hypothetical protein
MKHGQGRCLYNLSDGLQIGVELLGHQNTHKERELTSHLMQLFFCCVEFLAKLPPKAT